MLRDQGALALVVQAALLAAADPRHRIPTVEESRRLRVLLLLELDGELQIRPVAVYGQRRPTGRAGDGSPRSQSNLS